MKLHDRASDAEAEQRVARCVELSEQALSAAKPLFPADSLVFAVQHFGLAATRFMLAKRSLRGAQQAAAFRSCCADLEAGLAVLSTRAGNMVLRPDERAFELARREHLRKRQPPQARAIYTFMLLSLVACLPYACTLWGGMTSLAILTSCSVSPQLRTEAESAVLSALDAIAVYRSRPSAHPGLLNQETGFADLLDDFGVSHALSRSPWGLAVAASWRRPSVRGALQALGLAGGQAVAEARYKSMEADAAAKVEASGGLRRCALPACSVQELHFKHFRCCSGCRTTAYCCPEHAAQHWTSGHRAPCKAAQAAARAVAATAGDGREAQQERVAEAAFPVWQHRPTTTAQLTALLVAARSPPSVAPQIIPAAAHDVFPLPLSSPVAPAIVAPPRLSPTLAQLSTAVRDAVVGAIFAFSLAAVWELCRLLFRRSKVL